MAHSTNPILISVVIPTLCESAVIERAVRAAFQVGDEVIVVDAGSPDHTAELARRAGARVVIARPGRGSQLHAGALSAHGDVLVFLHADAELGAGARTAIIAALADASLQGGSFHLRFDRSGWATRFFAWAYDLRRRWLNIYYGDSALFVRRATYESLGGFREIPLFEDYEFVRRLEKRYKTAYIRGISVLVSARRFEDRPLRTLALWVMLQLGYMLGVPPERLAGSYAHRRRAEPV